MLAFTGAHQRTHAPTTAGALLVSLGTGRRDGWGELPAPCDEHARAALPVTVPVPVAWPAGGAARHGQRGLDACGVRFERRARPAGPLARTLAACPRWMHVPAGCSRVAWSSGITAARATTGREGRSGSALASRA